MVRKPVMWASNTDLPDHVRSTLSESKQTLFRQAVNYYRKNGTLKRQAIYKAWSILKSTPQTLYVRRDVLNAKDIVKWAKGQGFAATVPPDQMHVTIAFSRTPVDWMKVRQYPNYDNNGEYKIGPGGPRVVEPLGPQGAIVLLFADDQLAWRNKEIRDAGASWDWSGYQPHITITYQGTDLDLSKVTPYNGPITLGPEIFEPVNEDWSDNVIEKLDKAGARHSKNDNKMLQAIHDNAVDLGADCGGYLAKSKATFDMLKVDESLGLVFGWAIVCKKDGQDYFDLNRDEDGSSVPEHIPETSMLKAATDFMLNSRMAKEMHDGDSKGTVVFAFPMTSDIAKSLGINTRVTGLLIAMKPDNPEMLTKFSDGTYKGFSIGGSKVTFEDFIFNE